MRNTSVVA